MKIIEWDEKFDEYVKDLLVELQEFVISIDKLHLNKLDPKYREEYFKKTIKETYQNSGKIFLAEEGGKILGMIAGHERVYSRLDHLDYTCPKCGVVEELITTKAARGKGVGKKLLNALENHFKSIGCEFIKIGVFGYNDGAIRFYENAGYETRFIDLMKKIDEQKTQI